MSLLTTSFSLMNLDIRGLAGHAKHLHICVLRELGLGFLTLGSFI